MIREYDVWLRNRQSFADVCYGRYGREVLKTSAEFIDETNIVKELEQIEYIRRINARNIDYLERYYRGDQPGQYKTKQIRPEINNRVVENHAFEVVNFFKSQHYGEPIQYAIRNTVDDAQADNDNIDLLNKLMAKRNKARKDIELGEWQVICGTSYRLIYYTGDEKIPFDLVTLDPRYVGIIYDTKDKPIMSYQIGYDSDGEKTYYCHTKQMFYVVKDSKVIGKDINGFKQIPVIECPLNSKRLSYLEIVISLLDTINKIQSNRMDGIEQFVQSFIKFVNCEIDEDKFLKMCQLGAIKVKTNNPSCRADVQIMSEELSQQQTQIYKDDIISMIRTILGMPSRESNTGGDTGQAVYLRNGWDFAERMAKLWEPYAIQCENETLEIVAYILKYADSEYKMDLDTMNTEVNITRNKNDNLLVKSQALLNFKEVGIHPQDAYEVVGAFGDPEKVYQNMLQWKEDSRNDEGNQMPVQQTPVQNQPSNETG